jgi:cysteine-rich repeat protein
MPPLTRRTWLRTARVVPVAWLLFPGPSSASDHHATTSAAAVNVVPAPLDFFSVTPCRVVDTRTGSPLVAGIERTFPFAGVCGIPSTASAVSTNVAVTQPTAAGNVRLYPSGSLVPNSSTINYGAGQTRTNNIVVGLGNAGELSARSQPAGTTHLIIDVNGYFEPMPVCGNGAVEGSESCDDGNMNAGDGCSLTCTEEPGFTCAGSPSVCTTLCGDGIVVGSESCDDGNMNAGDGCSLTCTEEPGFTCAGSPSVCTTLCGDGIVVGSEGCDDGNMSPGDGCSASCTVEAGYTCVGSPSVCTIN